MDQLPITKFIKLLMALSILFLVMTLVIGVFGLAEFKQWIDRRDDKIMALEYCFTGNGERYPCDEGEVAKDEKDVVGVLKISFEDARGDSWFSLRSDEMKSDEAREIVEQIKTLLLSLKK